MPTGTFEYRTDAERQTIEQAIAFVTQMHDLALTAPPGHVLDQCEGHAVRAGRDLLRATLQQAAQASIDHAEQKKGAIAPARAEVGGTSSDGWAGTSCRPSGGSVWNAGTADAPAVRTSDSSPMIAWECRGS
jgi:hypothetical protein